MNFLQKLDWLMERDGLNKHTLSQKAEIPYTTIVGLYERGFENARLSTVNKLCSYFGVSLDYLAMDQYEKPDDFIPNGNTAKFIVENAEEIELVTLYRSLNDSARLVLLNTARGFSGNPDMQKERLNIVTA